MQNGLAGRPLRHLCFGRRGPGSSPPGAWPSACPPPERCHNGPAFSALIKGRPRVRLGAISLPGGPRLRMATAAAHDAFPSWRETRWRDRLALRRRAAQRPRMAALARDRRKLTAIPSKRPRVGSQPLEAALPCDSPNAASGSTPAAGASSSRMVPVP